MLPLLLVTPRYCTLPRSSMSLVTGVNRLLPVAAGKVDRSLRVEGVSGALRSEHPNRRYAVSGQRGVVPSMCAVLLLRERLVPLRACGLGRSAATGRYRARSILTSLWLLSTVLLASDADP